MNELPSQPSQPPAWFTRFVGIILISASGGLLLLMIICCGAIVTTDSPSQISAEQAAADATAEQQAEKEASAKAEARAAAASEKLQRDVELYAHKLADNPLIDQVLTGANGMLIVRVSDPWHVMAYQIRLQAAQDLWTIWRGIRGDDTGQYEIQDRNGNRVGGLSAWSGIWVQE